MNGVFRNDYHDYLIWTLRLMNSGVAQFQYPWNSLLGDVVPVHIMALQPV